MRSGAGAGPWAAAGSGESASATRSAPHTAALPSVRLEAALAASAVRSDDADAGAVGAELTGRPGVVVVGLGGGWGEGVVILADILGGAVVTVSGGVVEPLGQRPVIL